MTCVFFPIFIRCLGTWRIPFDASSWDKSLLSFPAAEVENLHCSAHRTVAQLSVTPRQVFSAHVNYSRPIADVLRCTHINFASTTSQYRICSPCYILMQSLLFVAVVQLFPRPQQFCCRLIVCWEFFGVWRLVLIMYCNNFACCY